MTITEDVAVVPGRGLDDDGSPPAPTAVRDSSRWWKARRLSRSGWITAGIGVLTAVLYTWNLSSVGTANDYYTAAVKSMSVSWKAFFFGSFDPGSFITVDKPPAALWVQALSARVFGFNTWSLLLPQAIAGVASVLILHRLVRRWAGDVAAHMASLALALTPVAVIMFRFNNPDALLTFLGLAAAWALLSAVETGRTRMLVLSAVLTGLAFDTKMLQAFLVLPAFVLVYLFAGPPKLGRRLLQLGAALVALLVSCGWWVAIVTLWPANSRPYIGSSEDNSVLNLIFGYNGLGRIFGSDGPSGGAVGAMTGGGVPGGGGGGNGSVGFGGASGWLRMFNLANGGQISWLLPLAGAGLLAGLWLTRRAPRTDRARAGWLLWGGWAITCVLVFSKSEGIFHPYYEVQLAPAVAALAGAGSVALWRLGGHHRWARWALPAAVVISAGWATVLLDRTPGYYSWLAPAIVVGAALATVGFWLGWRLRSRAVVITAGALAAVTLLAGPAAYSITTVWNAATGPLAAAGPAIGGPDPAGGGLPGDAGDGPGSTAVYDGLIAYLRAHQGDATYLLATFGSNAAGPFIIETGEPVITIGGFSGRDPLPTLAELQALIEAGEVRYVLTGVPGPGGGGGLGGGQSIEQWVVANGSVIPASEYGGSAVGTLYDVSGSA